MYFTNFGRDQEGNDLEYLGTEFETVEEIVALCEEYDKSVTLYNEQGFVVGWVHSDGNYTLT